jgi:hypothetical protein
MNNTQLKNFLKKKDIHDLCDFVYECMDELDRTIEETEFNDTVIQLAIDSMSNMITFIRLNEAPKEFLEEIASYFVTVKRKLSIARKGEPMISFYVDLTEEQKKQLKKVMK